MVAIKDEDIIAYTKITGNEPWVINYVGIEDLQWFRDSKGKLRINMELVTDDEIGNIELMEKIEKIEGKDLKIGIKYEGM